MNYYGPKEAAASFRTVRKNTLVIANEIPADKYSFRAAENTRSVGELLSHIALLHSFQHQVQSVERRTTLEGFDFPAFHQRIAADEKIARTKEQVIEMLKSSGEKWAGFVEGLTDSFLGEQVAMPAMLNNPPKSRFEMILGVKEHEMHHRGQLMLIERIIGIVPHLTREMQARMAAIPAKA
jgi:uncharacterized damage-inducible protein DinB